MASCPEETKGINKRRFSVVCLSACQASCMITILFSPLKGHNRLVISRGCSCANPG